MAVSPTLASLAVTTLAKGARMTMRSASVLASASLASARLHWDMAASYWALDMAPWLFKVVARSRSRRASAVTARVCSRRASISRAESLTRISPARTEAVSYTHLRAHETPEHLV